MKMSEKPRLTRNVFIKQRLKCAFFRKIKQAKPLPSNMKTDINPFSSRNMRSSDSSHSEIDPDSLKGTGVLVPEVKFDSAINMDNWNPCHGIVKSFSSFSRTLWKLTLLESSSRKVQMSIGSCWLKRQLVGGGATSNTEITILRV